MENNRYKLISVLSGLVGALGANHKTEDTDRVLLEALALFHRLPEGPEAELAPETIAELRAGVLAVRREKYTIVPGCAGCQTACRNTADLDFQEILDAEPRERALKLCLLEQAGRAAEALLKSAAAEQNAETITDLYQTISLVAWESDPDYLIAMQQRLENALAAEQQ